MQKKREAYHSQIRRKHIEKFFKSKREEFQSNEQQLAQEVHRLLSQDAIRLIFMVKRAFMEGSYELGHELLSKIHKQITLGGRDSEYIEPICGVFGECVRRVVENETEIEEQKGQSWRKMPEGEQLSAIQSILGLLVSLEFNEASKQDIVKFYLPFSVIFKWEHASKRPQLLPMALEITQHILRCNNAIINKALKAAGLGSHLVFLIQHRSKYFSVGEHSYLINTLNMYILSEWSPTEIKDAIAILGLESAEKERFLAYCLNLIHNKYDELLVLAISCLIAIFEQHQYMTEEVHYDCLKQICELTSHPDREVQAKASELLNDIIFYSKEASNRLLCGNYLPDLLMRALLFEQRHDDQFSKDIISKYVFVLCNLTLTIDRKLKENLATHSIWNLAYENMNPAGKLFPLISVFEYYFAMIGRVRVIQVLDSFLCAVSEIDFNHIYGREKKSLRNTLANIYLQAKGFWPEKDFCYFCQLIQTYKLNSIYEEFMDVEIEINE